MSVALTLFLFVLLNGTLLKKLQSIFNLLLLQILHLLRHSKQYIGSVLHNLNVQNNQIIKEQWLILNNTASPPRRCDHIFWDPTLLVEDSDLYRAFHCFCLLTESLTYWQINKVIYNLSNAANACGQIKSTKQQKMSWDLNFTIYVSMSCNHVRTPKGKLDLLLWNSHLTSGPIISSNGKMLEVFFFS